LYAADAPDLLRAVRDVPAVVRTLLLIGHNPGLAELVLELAGDGLNDTLDRVRTKFPTAAIAVLAWHGTTWETLAPGAALLTDVIVARGKREK
jgi:phosphohistidine phosphatase